MSLATQLAKAVDIAHASGNSEAIFKALKPMVSLLVWVKTHTRDEDLIMEVIEAIMLGDFRGGSRYSTWAWKIAVNQSNKALEAKITRRRTLREVSLEEACSISVQLGSPPRLPNFGVDLSASEKAILQLKLEGYTHPEIAKAMDISLATFKRQWAVIIDRIRRGNG